MGGDTRERLLECAEQMLRERGLSYLSTRELARAAGVAEGAMYHHFADKTELLLAVIGRSGSELFEKIRNLVQQAGSQPVRETLVEVAWPTYQFHRHTIPITCSLFADTELLAQHRQILRTKKVGPVRINEALVAYLAEQQRLGRVATQADPEAIVTLLIGGCFQLGYLETFMSQRMTQADARQRIEAMVRTLCVGLTP